jgi:hypothetical protein
MGKLVFLIPEGGCMDKEKLLKKIAELETINDQLQAELRYLDTLLRQAGFENGLTTLKHAAQELIEEDNHSN